MITASSHTTKPPRKTVTIDISYDNYIKAKTEAQKKNLQLKQIVNKRLEEAFEKEEFLSRVAPFMSIDSYEGNRIMIKDVQNKVLVDVFYKDGDLFCEVDNTCSCKHTRFVWMAPNISKILPWKKIKTNGVS